MMNRRLFLQGILIGMSAPVIVRADSLMKIVPNDLLFIDEVNNLHADWISAGMGKSAIIEAFCKAKGLHYEVLRFSTTLK